MKGSKNQTVERGKQSTEKACVGVHIERKKWGVLSQAVRIYVEEITPLKDSWRNEILGSSS